MSVTIKRHFNHNDYYLAKNGLWVRNFAKSVKPIDINHLSDEHDYKLFIENQMINMRFNLARIDSERIYAPNIVILSDGHKFDEKKHILSKLKNVVFIGVNRTLARWDGKYKIDYYVINNPYQESLSFLNNYYPRCIASIRTNPEFVRRYLSRRGVVYQYNPVPNMKFSGLSNASQYYIDDYRNAICAAIGLAFRWEVQKLMFFCCDDVFESERPSAEKLHNGLWMYPQHNTPHSLIEGNIFWLAHYNKNLQVVDHSSGPKYEHITYIDEDDIVEFFR